MAEVSGTREWSVISYNCVTGCSNDCLYCYARHMAMGGTGSKPWVKSVEEWRQPKPRPHDLAKSKKLYAGIVMFPTTHDILPETLNFCLEALGNLLRAGNQVLVVSKPHMECIKAICSRFASYVTSCPNNGQLELRFTIGTDDEALLKFWEPGAPTFEERFQCLQHAFKAGFATSVSMEPMLKPSTTIPLVQKLLPFVTKSVWLGLMNKPNQRVQFDIEDDRHVLDELLAKYESNVMEEIHEAFKDNDKVHWKMELRRRLGI